jgi:hypothetical protein
MYSLSFLIVELETARTTLLDVFAVSNGRPNWTWHAAIAGCELLAFRYQRAQPSPDYEGANTSTRV